MLTQNEIDTLLELDEQISSEASTITIYQYDIIESLRNKGLITKSNDGPIVFTHKTTFEKGSNQVIASNVHSFTNVHQSYIFSVVAPNIVSTNDIFGTSSSNTITFGETTDLTLEGKMVVTALKNANKRAGKAS